MQKQFLRGQGARNDRLLSRINLRNFPSLTMDEEPRTLELHFDTKDETYVATALKPNVHNQGRRLISLPPGVNVRLRQSSDARRVTIDIDFPSTSRV